jgi:hypothetical protein
VSFLGRRSFGRLGRRFGGLGRRRDELGELLAGLFELLGRLEPGHRATLSQPAAVLTMGASPRFLRRKLHNETIDVFFGVRYSKENVHQSVRIS